MSKKLILILAAVATTAFTLAYAVTVWAYGGGCCGFCGFQLTRTDAASRCYEAQLCRQCFYIALEGIVMRRGRVLLLVIAVLVVSAVAGVVTALYRLGKLAPQPIASRGPTRSRRRSYQYRFAIIYQQISHHYRYLRQTFHLFILVRLASEQNLDSGQLAGTFQVAQFHITYFNLNFCS